MKPWNTDGDLANFDGQNNLNKNIVFNDIINDYLENTGDNDYKFFIVAPKGYGKTLLLKAKSTKYRRKSGYNCIPENSLLEKMIGSTISFNVNELNQYKTLTIWEDIWLLSLLILIQKNVDNQQPIKDLNKLVGNSNSLSEILYNVLDDRKNLYSKYVKLIHKELFPAIRKIHSQIAVFIDNIDQAFDNHIGENFKREKRETGSGGLSPKVWVYAQLGLVNAVKKICSQNKHIKIFASIRSEAFILDDSPTALIQDKNYTTELEYEKEELYSIFLKNITNTESRKLVFPETKTSLLKKFIGFTEIPHKFVKDSFELPIYEHIFDFIWRHTFKRPREIVEMGKRIYSIPPKKRTIKKIWETVNSTSNILLQQYKNEMIPFFRDDVYDELCKQIGSNVIRKEKAEEISKSIKENSELKFENVFQSLYRLGIVGWIERDELKESKITQDFLEAAYYNFYQKKEIPLYSDYFLLHPSTDEDLHRYHGKNYYNSENIIGYEREFYEKNNPSKINHIHIGAGRVTLCFLLPIFSKTSSIALIQKPCNEWGDLSSYKEMIVTVNDKVKSELKIYHDNLSQNEKTTLINKWINKNANIFFYTNDFDTIDILIRNTKGISIIRRSDYKWILDILYQNNLEKNLNLYLINLNKQDYKRIQIELYDNDCLNVKTIPVIADRYFYKKDEKRDGKKLLIDVISESNFKELVFYSKNNIASKLLYPNEVIELTSSSHEFRFYLKKFRLLSEGIFKLEKLFLHTKSFQFDENSIFQLFVEIQFHVLKEYLNKESVKEHIFPGLLDTEIDEKVKGVANAYRQRVKDLPNDFKKVRHIAHYIERVAEQQILPEEDKLFRILSRIKQTSIFSKNSIISLLRLFNYKVTKKISSLLFNINELKEKKIFISYSRKDKPVVDKIDFSFKEHFDIDIIRDEKNLSYRENIEKFMRQIRDADFAFLLISDHYLKSKYCMFELLELSKEKDFLKKMLPITNEVSIFEEDFDKSYLLYWEEQLQLEEGNITHQSTKEEIEKVELIRQITKQIKGFINDWRAMRLLSFQDLEAANYLPILKILTSSENI